MDKQITQALLAAKWLLAKDPAELAGILQAQQDMGWPEPLIRAAARMVSAA